jgi:HJR/Mrr/RecB family endonuclease
MGIAQLIALVVLASTLLPQVRQMLLGLGLIAFWVVVLVGGTALVVILIRRTERKPVPFSVDRTQAIREVNVPPNADRAALGRQMSDQIAPATTAELLDGLRSIDWFQFEKVVALAFRKLGYTVARRGGANPDGGIDLVVEKDGQRSAVQCKQWKTWNVGVKAVREFLGALTDAGIQKGIFITLCGYTGEAKQLAEKHGIEIVNETGLAQMLEATNARIDPETLATLRDTRKFCPRCESEMVIRVATKGPGAGEQFWGCSAFPRCRFTMRAS